VRTSGGHIALLLKELFSPSAFYSPKWLKIETPNRLLPV